MPIVLSHLNVLLPDQVLPDTTVVIADQRIQYIGPESGVPLVRGDEYQLPGLFLALGFFDVHVHGGVGIQFGGTDDPAQELARYSEWVVSTGTCAYLCSIAAPSAAELIAKVTNFVPALESEYNGALPLGLHLEGPYLNPERKGAFSPAWLRQPDLDEAVALIEAGRGWICQVTLAPELPGADQVAQLFAAAGIVVALGHSNTDYTVTRAALQGEYRHVTHTFNAQRGFHHREPGVLGAVLASDDITAELIADNVHVHPGAMRVLLRCLGTDRVVLVTDAMAAAGLPDGEYDLLGNIVTVQGGRATLPDGTIASSTAGMHDCVRNANQLLDVPMYAAAKMASSVPARAMGVSDRIGSLAFGQPANLVVFDDQVDIAMTVVSGRVAYRTV